MAATAFTKIQQRYGIEVIRYDDSLLKMKMGDATITQEFNRNKITVNLGDVRVAEMHHQEAVLVFVDNGLTLKGLDLFGPAREVWQAVEP